MFKAVTHPSITLASASSTSSSTNNGNGNGVSQSVLANPYNPPTSNSNTVNNVILITPLSNGGMNGASHIDSSSTTTTDIVFEIDTSRDFDTKSVQILDHHTKKVNNVNEQCGGQNSKVLVVKEPKISDGSAHLVGEKVASRSESSGDGGQEEGNTSHELDIVINNVVGSFSVRCHLSLRQIALNGVNVEYRRENGMVTMKLRRPYTTASIWSSGKITCTGAISESQARVAARKYARILQKLGFEAKFHNFRVVNVLASCSLPFGINIAQLSSANKAHASYEPELHPGATYRMKSPKATLKLFTTGSITVTARSVDFIQQAIENIFPVVYEYRKKKEDLPKIIKEKSKDGFSTFQKSSSVSSNNSCSRNNSTNTSSHRQQSDNKRLRTTTQTSKDPKHFPYSIR